MVTNDPDLARIEAYLRAHGDRRGDRSTIGMMADDLDFEDIAAFAVLLNRGVIEGRWSLNLSGRSSDSRALLVEWWTSEAARSAPPELIVRTAHALGYAVCPSCAGSGGWKQPPDSADLGCAECDGLGFVDR